MAGLVDATTRRPPRPWKRHKTADEYQELYPNEGSVP